MTPGELYEKGDLNGAVQAALDGVRASATDTARRWLLAELLCFTGQLEKADNQLDTIVKQDPKALMNVSLFRQLIRGEQARQQFFAEGRVPEVLDKPSPLLEAHLKASIALRENAPAEAFELLAAAEQHRTLFTGTCDGLSFSEFRDIDDLTSSFFEVLTSTGKYYWIPMAWVESIEFRKPERARDILWRPAHMNVSDGPEGEVYLPTLYPGTHLSDDDQLRLGRATDWTEDETAPLRGRGLRMFLIDDEPRTIMQLTNYERAD